MGLPWWDHSCGLAWIDLSWAGLCYLRVPCGKWPKVLEIRVEPMLIAADKALTLGSPEARASENRDTTGSHIALLSISGQVSWTRGLSPECGCLVMRVLSPIEGLSSRK